MAKLTPMMEQYRSVKDRYTDCILFYRLGDFYEMFFEDALTASKALEITLTGRNCGLEEKAPMCGVPYHSAQGYIAKLIAKGFKVAICEQIEDVSEAKGLVKRDVVRVVTPGTITESSMLDEKKNNYLMSIYKKGSIYSIASCDISTGDFYATQITYGDTLTKVVDEIAKYKPAEIVVSNEIFDNKNLCKVLEDNFGVYISRSDDIYFQRDQALEIIKDKINNIKIKEYDIWVNAAGALMAYIIETRKTSISHIRNIQNYEFSKFMSLDSVARKNMELCENLREGKKKGSLLWVLDKTATSMGGRTLRSWLEQPLVNVEEINERLDAVGELKNKYIVRMELFDLLKGVYDIERLTSKVIMQSANCRDLVALKASIGQMPYIKELIKDSKSLLLKQIYEYIDNLEDIYELIEASIVDSPPTTIKSGGIIKDGYSDKADEYKKASKEGKQWILDLEAREREKTGIKKLKIGYNKVFGYYFDVTRSYFDLVPEYFIRKQTLINSERYITEELKSMEDTILGAHDKLMNLEYELFTEIRELISSKGDRLLATGKAIAILDTLVSLGEIADREKYVKPSVNESYDINIKGGRHPVVEKIGINEEFIPNDTKLDNEKNSTAIITGPNMAGKSTFMRQTAVIVIMAQIGSFVPAKSASIGIVDRIYTRIGAADDLAGGQSTFMLEMSEVAQILKGATDRSLLILDEIGRGTSTYDGLAIAWAVIEYIAKNKKCRTLFSTHYHELTELEGKIDGVKNYCILAEKDGHNVTFLRKVVRGGADDSFGIQVANLAGVPKKVIIRAESILKTLEDTNVNRSKKIKHAVADGQVNIMEFTTKNESEKDVIENIKKMNIQEMTPLEALNKIYELKDKLK